MKRWYAEIRDFLAGAALGLFLVVVTYWALAAFEAEFGDLDDPRALRAYGRERARARAQEVIADALRSARRPR